MATAVRRKRVLVTGGSSGIGRALCGVLAKDHNCHVYLTARSLERGQTAAAELGDAHIEVLQMDTTDATSVESCAAVLRDKGVTLYALVNNAGVGLNNISDLGLSSEAQTQLVLNTNFKGPQRVTEAFVDMLEDEGRIVNVSSGSASGWLCQQDENVKALFSDPNITIDQLDDAVDAALKEGRVGSLCGYGLSKAALTALTLYHAKLYPHLKVVSLSPGFIDTNMTRGFGARLTPVEGCRSSIKCLFDDVTPGWYYGSDGLRSPMTCPRDPGMPEYEGEANPQRSKYNR